MTERGQEGDLASALDQFDRAEANLAKAEHVWAELQNLIPIGVVFGRNPEAENLTRAFTHIADALPAIEGFRIDAIPMSLDEIAQSRLDALELGEPELTVRVESQIDEPGKQLDEYRYRLESTRRGLVREHVMEVVSRIDQVLRDVRAVEGLGEWKGESRWGELSDLISELDRLVGNMVPGRARWSDLHRHLHFAQSNDLSDIATMDWPSVRVEIEETLYNDREPIPVTVDDLGALARARPTGPVSTRLLWENLSPEDFERLLFELVRQAPGYENANWLMNTNAPDRGRDLEVYRVVSDELGGTRRYRVIIQCKHWLGRSVGGKELIECTELVKLWEPPPVDVLIVATSGRFSQDAVALIERRNRERTLPAVEPWPDNHLEMLLARRPGLTAKYRLR